MKVEYDRTQQRAYGVISRRSQMGKTRILIACPFCQGTFWAYVWSLAGSGKRCEHCGAWHGSFGAYPKKVET